MVNKGSCYNCQNRKQGCHANCETYLQYKLRLAKIKANKEAYNRSFPIAKLRKYAV